MFSSARRSRFSASAACRSVTWRSRTSFSLASWSRSCLASSVAPTQPNRSRKGLSAREAPSWIGPRTWSAPRCTAWSPPLADSPKYTVSSTSDAITNPASTARRRLTCLSYMGGVGSVPPRGGPEVLGAAACGLAADGLAFLAVAAAVGPVDRLELLQRAAGADRHAREGRLGAVRRHLRLLAQ